MIPIKLEIANFLSYRDTAVLDFNGIHLACIAGLNGAGKSSILDAMTWALFGQSRSRSDDDLVNRLAALNGDPAQVSLIFELEGSIYRILRRKKPGKTAVLEFHIASDPEMSNWKSLSESRLRDTQAAIESLLRMNYDTFINASFLLQGKADEFTTKTPGKRKEILADLLGVNAWDVYKERAAEKRKGAEGRIALLDGLLEEIESELAEEGERSAGLDEAKTALAAVSERLKDKEQVLDGLRRAENAVQQQKQLVQNLAGNLARARNAAAGLEESRQKRQEEREAYRAILAAAAEIQLAHAAWQTAEAEVKSWQVKADEFNRLQQAKRPYELAFAETRSRLEQEQRALIAQSGQASEADAEKERRSLALAEARSRLAELQADLETLAEQETALHEVQTALQKLESEREHARQELARLQKEAERMKGMETERTAVLENLAQAEAELKSLTQKTAAMGEKFNQHATLKAELDALQAEQPRLKEEMNKIKSRLDNLAGEMGGECPLCGQPLSDDHRQKVLAELETEGEGKGNRYRQNKTRLEHLVDEVAGLAGELKQKPRLERDQKTQQERFSRAKARQEEIEKALAGWAESGTLLHLAALEKQLADTRGAADLKQKLAGLEAAVGRKRSLEKDRDEQQRQIAAAEARLAEINRLVDAWETTGKLTLARISRSLDEADYEPEAKTALAGFDEEIAALEYDAEAHALAREARDRLADAEARYQAFQQAEAAVKPLEAALTDLDQQIKAQNETTATLETQLKEAETQLESLAVDPDERNRVAEEVSMLRDDQITANRRVGAAEQKLSVLGDLRARRQKLQGERAEVTQLVQRLKLLEKACGRDGVQALLIEQALPEIEDHANELLERLSSGGMRVTFETQRELKSREGLAETLDIRIQDSAGERPYANYSGGEQFRVNFAIRLALSQLLAKRAGARLQTLVIDEGFGSQDPDGRQRLIEAINTIQADFARVLVITHVAALKDAFPTRIQVEKSLSGSNLTVI